MLPGQVIKPSLLVTVPFCGGVMVSVYDTNWSLKTVPELSVPPALVVP